MIISYQNKYIFWKPTKVGGSSVLQALGAHCGPHDKVGEPGKLEGLPGYGQNRNSKNGGTISNHAPPEFLKKEVTKEEWKDFHKFTIVRNPWDEIVSRFWHDKTRGLVHIRTKNFEEIKTVFNNYVHKQPNVNARYYFENGKLIADYYMRFEHLADDYKTVCNKVGIPHEELPRLKSGHRQIQQPYNEYYIPESVNCVQQKFIETIEHFGYSFGSELEKEERV